MPRITTRVATLDEWDDVQAALTGGGDGRACQCMWPVLTAAQWDATTRQQRQEMLRSELAEGPPPGVVAYVDGQAAGWVRIGPRLAQRRLHASRILKSGSEHPIDDESVWAVTCFSIRREFRGKGISSALLDAAVEYAKGRGARIVEAYAIATDTRAQTPSNWLYTGAVSTYLKAGFREVARPTANRVVVEKTLG